jgi:hypothetical protein
MSAFDAIPVRSEGRILGVLERRVDVADAALVADLMRRLDDTMLVASSTGIRNYLRLARQSHYHLVVRQSSVQGIVTRSDLLKLPVRTLLFTLITHLESVMADRIRRSGGDGWMERLSPARRRRIEEKFDELKGRRLDIDRLLLTEFCDKRDLVSKLVLAGAEKSDFQRELKLLELLRNDIAHADRYPEDAGMLDDRANQAWHWIRRLA